MLRLAFLIAMAGGAYVLASPAWAQEAPSLDPAGIRGVRYLMRDDARMAAIIPGADTTLNWFASGITRPGETITPAQVRTAFEGNVIQAERRFAQAFIVTGTLRSVSRRADRQIVVQFVEGGLADRQRRALARLGAEGDRLNQTEILGDLMGGRMYSGAIAVLSTEHEDAVANWNADAKVTLHCRGASNVPLAVLLDGCVPQSAVIAAADRLADAQSDLVLARQPLTIPPAPKRDNGRDPAQRSKAFLAMGYVFGLLGRECSDIDVGEWVKCSDRIQKQRQPPGREDAVLQQIARDLDIPELAVPRSKGSPAPPRATPAPRK